MSVRNRPQMLFLYDIRGINKLDYYSWVIRKAHRNQSFVEAHALLLEQCLNSLLNRDHPDPQKRNGLMGFDSSRTQGGGEITTYDSLDHSLGQARNNVYLAGKAWASYLALEALLKMIDKDDLAQSAYQGNILTASTLENAFDTSVGYIPAVLENNNQSAIIPAVEALIYPHKMGLSQYLDPEGPFSGYLSVLKNMCKIS